MRSEGVVSIETAGPCDMVERTTAYARTRSRRCRYPPPPRHSESIQRVNERGLGSAHGSSQSSGPDPVLPMISGGIPRGGIGV